VSDDDPRVKDTIKWYVKQRAANRRPVLVVLAGVMAIRQELLREARRRFGPLCFFYMGKDPAPAAALGDLGLESVLPTGGALRALSDYNRLKNL
jgi:hypothetical protein